MAMKGKTGRNVTDAELDRMAVDAEAGYDLSTWKRRAGRPSLGDTHSGGHSPRITTRVPEELQARVASRAAAEGKSVSAVMRDLLEAYAGEPPAEAARSSPLRRRAFGTAGAFSSGRSDTSEHHDEALGEETRW